MLEDDDELLLLELELDELELLDDELEDELDVSIQDLIHFHTCH